MTEPLTQMPPLVDTPLLTTMCRYEMGELVTASMPVRDTKYIAISHVWGAARWQAVLGREILVSDEKATFIAQNLAPIVGGEWFWMDILCINQLDKDSRVAITQHIPTIFRCAQRTLVVKNSEGLQGCCIQVALNSMGDDLLLSRRALAHHLCDVHQTGGGCRFHEAVYDRLWPLQEVIVSNSLQFVRCEAVAPSTTQDVTGIPKRLHPSFLEFLGYFRETARAWGWLSHDSHKEDSLNLEFLNAFIFDQTVSRVAPQMRKFPSERDLMDFAQSRRVTSHPRDYVLAIMPQYEFYKVPSRAREMTFGELFVDCFQQGNQAGWELTPLISAENAAGRVPMHTPTQDIPEPCCLGDAIKLLLGPRTDRRYSKLEVQEVEVERNVLDSEATDVIEILHQCYRYSIDFRLAISHFANAPRDNAMDSFETDQWDDYDMETRWRYELAFAKEALSLWCGNRERLDTNLPKILNLDRVWIQAIIRLAAVVNCGLGFGAYAWSVAYLTPVLVRLQGQQILAMVPNSVAKDGQCRFGVAKGQTLWGGRGRVVIRYALISVTDGCDDYKCVCLFPGLDSGAESHEMLSSTSE